jgi:TonB family protein
MNKNRGKVICKELKELRRKIAEENDIPLEIKECTYEGPCRGTCPRCEAEVRYLENSLANRLRMGKVATVAGLALGLASCGSQQQGEPATPPAPTSSGEGSVTTVDSQRPEVPEGPESRINVPDVGEIEIFGEVAPPDESLAEGFVEYFEEGGIPEDNTADILTVCAQDPEFPGGIDALYKFLQDNLSYPTLALENGISGTVYVTYVVETDGTVANPKILRDIGGGCGQEALRVVKMMPKWKPGMNEGKPVRVQFNLPVRFVLPEDRMQIIEGKALPIQGKPAAPPVNGADAPSQDSVKVIVK